MSRCRRYNGYGYGFWVAGQLSRFSLYLTFSGLFVTICNFIVLKCCIICFSMSIGLIHSSQHKKLPIEAGRCNRIRFIDYSAIQPVERVNFNFLAFMVMSSVFEWSLSAH